MFLRSAVRVRTAVCLPLSFALLACSSAREPQSPQQEQRLARLHSAGIGVPLVLHPIRVLGRPVVVGGRTVRAQVSVMDVAEETDAGQVIEVTRTVLSLRTSDIVGIAAGAAATVDGEDYRIRVVLPDGRGLARVVLE